MSGTVDFQFSRVYLDTVPGGVAQTCRRYGGVPLAVALGGGVALLVGQWGQGSGWRVALAVALGRQCRRARGKQRCQEPISGTPTRRKLRLLRERFLTPLIPPQLPRTPAEITNSEAGLKPCVTEELCQSKIQELRRECVDSFVPSGVKCNHFRFVASAGASAIGSSTKRRMTADSLARKPTCIPTARRIWH